jgi:L,D-transpeptidase ErfK/SrfK
VSGFFYKSYVVVLVFSVFMGGLWPTPAQAEQYKESYVGDLTTHRTVYEDTLVNIARDNSLGFIELRAANPGIDPWLPGAGVRLTLPTMHLLPDAPKEGVVINLPEMRIYAYVNGADAPITHPIGVGREGLSTPEGVTSVTRKTIGPTWRPTARMRSEDPSLPEYIGPGTANPMGTHALYLGWPAYAIHGTNKPFGIGRRVSSGCIRLYPEDIVRFYDMIDVGTKVRVVDQPIKAAWVEGKLYLEAHTSMTQADQMEQEGSVPDYEITDADMDIIIKAAGDHHDLVNWRAVRQIIRERRGVPFVIAARIIAENDVENVTGQEPPQKEAALQR